MLFLLVKCAALQLMKQGLSYRWTDSEKGVGSKNNKIGAYIVSHPEFHLSLAVLFQLCPFASCMLCPFLIRNEGEWEQLDIHVFWCLTVDTQLFVCLRPANIISTLASFATTHLSWYNHRYWVTSLTLVCLHLFSGCSQIFWYSSFTYSV
jgi:hypothetical protein